MADNYNLIPAAELPITEAKEVDVLCVENGEIKRKAAANLGGSDGGGYVIRLTLEDFDGLGEPEPDETGALTLPVASESYDNFIEVLLAGGSVWIDWTVFFEASGLPGTGYSSASAWFYAALGDIHAVILRTELFASMGSMSMAMPYNLIFPNGTWTPTTAASTGEA